MELEQLEFKKIDGKLVVYVNYKELDLDNVVGLHAIVDSGNIMLEIKQKMFMLNGGGKR